MIYHVIPKIFNTFVDADINLIDVSVPEMYLHLQSNRDIIARKPRPNKCYSVACRKKGRKAINGILLEHERLNKFTVTTRWALNADIVLEHIVNFQILDDDFECVSADPTKWYATRGGYSSRCPERHQNAVPCKLQPRMDVAKKSQRDYGREGDIKDFYQNGILVKRIENYSVPTIEQSRLFGDYLKVDEGRLPSLGDAFSMPVNV